jgi:ribosome-binding factor A
MANMTQRLRRVNDLLRDELSELIRLELKDPRLDALITITEVEASGDLRHARVFVSIFATDEERDLAMKGLAKAAPFLRRELSSRIRMRYIPELSFRYDDRIEEGARMLSLLNEVRSTNTEAVPPKSPRRSSPKHDGGGDTAQRTPKAP